MQGSLVTCSARSDGSLSSVLPTALRYPTAERLPLVEQLSGRWVADPYRWLEDAADPRTIAWSAAEDALARPYLDALPGRAALTNRLRTLLSSRSIGAPRYRGDAGNTAGNDTGDTAFWSERTGEQQHAVLYTGRGTSSGLPGRTGVEGRRPLLDPMALDPSGLTTLDGWAPSPDGRLLAYLVSSGGDEESELRVLDVATGIDVDGPLDRTRYSPVAWLPDSSGFYYVRRLRRDDPYHRRVWLRRLGDPLDGSGDTYVLGEDRDPRTYFGVDLSVDGRWLVVSAAVGTEPRDDVWLADVAGAVGSTVPTFTTVQEGVDARCFAGVEHDGRLYIWTDREAPRGRLCVADPAQPAAWSELVPEDPEAVLSSFAVLDDEVVVSRSRHAIAEVAVLDRMSGRQLRDVPLPGLGSVTSISAHPAGGTLAWIGWTDTATPPLVLLLDGTLWEPSDGAPDASTSVAPLVNAWQESYISRDGTTVRLTVLAPSADSSVPGDPDVPRPTVLYGYGGFGVALEQAYSASALAWVAAGGVWATAHLRGGSEEGEQWHRAGMREHKQNVFDDLHAAAEHLRTTGRASRLGISGGSNGGLLVGAGLTQRPDLYDAVLCSAPLLDMVRYEHFGLGSTWNDEYGTADDPVELGWLLAYSPYHAVREPGMPGPAYPALLVEVFEGDSRVDPLHGRKLVAALQAVQPPDGPPIVLRRESGVGHSARSLDRTIGLAVDGLAFLASTSGSRSGPGQTRTGDDRCRPRPAGAADRRVRCEPGGAVPIGARHDAQPVPGLGRRGALRDAAACRPRRARRAARPPHPAPRDPPARRPLPRRQHGQLERAAAHPCAAAAGRRPRRPAGHRAAPAAGRDGRDAAAQHRVVHRVRRRVHDYPR